MNLHRLVNTQSNYLIQKYGFRVFKIGLSTGIACPNKCHFCQKETFVDSTNDTFQTLNLTIDNLIEKIKTKVKASAYIAYFQDGTSFLGDPDYLFNMFKVADNHQDIVELIISTRPDCLPVNILNKLEELSKPVTIEIGIQTTSDDSLLYLNRGHTQSDNDKAIEILNNYNFRVGVHIILGIPGETKQQIDNTLNWINNNMIIKDVKIHHLAVYKGTKLAEIIDKEDIINLEDYLSLLIYFTKNLRKDITISRLFTSNLSKNRTMLNDFPGNKRIWLKKFETYSYDL